ncbi:putative intron-associated endonuclease 1 [Clostridium phage vB_CtyS-FA67]|nr:putative intron-associated endonuclease 1 [Clostridium phage vB_CtyS-FA67]
MKGIIYVAENIINGKRYVGQTIRKFEERQAQHKKDSERLDFKFYRAIRKYGWDNFNWAVIVEGVESVESLNSLEQYWIKELDTFESGYNSTTGGEGYIVSDETKKKLSESRKGRQFSEETKKKLSESKKGEKNPNYGKHLSEETKKKISGSKKGRTGANNPRSKPVLQLDKETGEVIAEFAGIKEAERVTGINNGHISNVCRGERKSAGGYYWQYKE